MNLSLLELGRDDYIWPHVLTPVGIVSSVCPGGCEILTFQSPPEAPGVLSCSSDTEVTTH